MQQARIMTFEQFSSTNIAWPQKDGSRKGTSLGWVLGHHAAWLIDSVKALDKCSLTRMQAPLHTQIHTPTHAYTHAYISY